MSPFQSLTQHPFTLDPSPFPSVSRQLKQPIAYHLEKPPKALKELKRRFRAEQLGVLEKLNRSDVSHLTRLKVLVIPDRWDLPELDYSPFPPRYPWTERHEKVLVVDLAGQAFGAYESGRLVRWGPISSGRSDNPTPNGLFYLNWKSAGRHSTINPEWYMRWYYNFGNCEGRAFHAYSLPGYPASHACIRLLERDAEWLFHWGESWELGTRVWQIREYGTPVLILGQYRFGEPPPWRSLDWLAEGIGLPSDPVPETTVKPGDSN